MAAVNIVSDRRMDGVVWRKRCRRKMVGRAGAIVDIVFKYKSVCEKVKTEHMDMFGVV